MDASQYNGSVRLMLSIKYISDKYSNSSDFVAPVTILEGTSFTDMVALKGRLSRNAIAEGFINNVRNTIIVVVHELAHLIAPTHSERFVALLNQHYPTWRGPGQS